MAAEVGLLTRNIKIIGEDYAQLQNEAFGARVLVGSYTEDGSTFTGKLNLDPTAVYTMIRLFTKYGRIKH